ncbi:MAG: PilW family protein [Bacillota bacterium]
MERRETIKREEGFTLIEVIAAVVVSGIIVALLTTMIMSYHRFSSIIDESSDVRRDVRLAARTLSNELVNVDKLNGDGSGGLLGHVQFDSDNGELLIERPDGHGIVIGGEDVEIRNVEFDLKRKTVDTDKYIESIEFTIEAGHHFSDEDFELTSVINLNNEPKYESSTGSSDVNEFYYNLPD